MTTTSTSKRYLSLFISNWYWFVISLFLAITLAYGINRYSEKMYTVSSTLLIKDGKNGGTLSSPENIMPGAICLTTGKTLIMKWEY